MIHQKKWHQNLYVKIPANLLAWLQHVDSFMERLKEHGISDAKIEIIDESWQIPFEDEQPLLKVFQEAFVREVWITSPNQCWMFARTVIPRTFLQGKYATLANLNTRPIGTILFEDKNIKRGKFEFICLDSTSDLYHKIQKYKTNQAIFARRSLFHIAEKSLLLTEVFMPDILRL